MSIDEKAFDHAVALNAGIDRTKLRMIIGWYEAAKVAEQPVMGGARSSDQTTVASANQQPVELSEHGLLKRFAKMLRDFEGAKISYANYTTDAEDFVRVAREHFAHATKRESVAPQYKDLLTAATLALDEMCNTVSPRNSFTDAVDKLDAAVCDVIEGGKP